MIRLTLVCHAATRAVRGAAFPLDEPIDPSGLRQATALAGTFAGAHRAWTSPALRARQTAAALGLDAAVEPLLGECDYGLWAGRRLAEVQAEQPAAVAAWIGDPAAAPHGGESLLDVLNRAAAWLDAQARETGHVVAVTHSAIVRAAILHAIGAPPAAFWRIDAAPLSWTDLRGDGASWTLRATGLTA